MKTLKTLIKELAEEFHAENIEIRRHLHMHPELSFKEHQTSRYIQSKLDDIGVSWTSVAGTGISAVIVGRRSSKVVALRADMDALPIQELNETPYASENSGIMHACGHDFHTASLLGAARILTQIKDQLNGTIKLLFQPGEEVIPGGAQLMIKDGVLEDPCPIAVIGQHAMPRIEAGKIGIRSGMFMASNDKLMVKVKGRGGHAGEPHLSVDPVVIAANILVALQQIVSRRADPRDPSVLSFGRVVANGAYNVIPDQVTMEGTFRTTSQSWRTKAHKLMTSIAEAIANGMGGSCEFIVQNGYPALSNDRKLTEDIKRDAEEYLGADNVLPAKIWMAAEDFAYYGQSVDSCFYLCGVGSQAKGICSPLHTATFDIDEDALRTSTGLLAFLSVKRLS